MIEIGNNCKIKNSVIQCSDKMIINGVELPKCLSRCNNPIIINGKIYKENNMKIKQIKEANYLYNKHNEELELERKNLYNINNNIDIEEFKNLTYEEMKEVISLISYKCDNLIKNKLKEIYEIKRIETYPQLLNAIYYTELNNIDFLTKEQIKEVDNLLIYWRVGNYLNDSFQYKISLDKDLYNKLIEFLYDNKIVSKTYKFICNECGENIDFIDENRYNELLRIFNIPPEERTEEDWDNAFFELACMECDYYREIETKEKFGECNVEVIYRLIKKADRSKNEL